MKLLALKQNLSAETNICSVVISTCFLQCVMQVKVPWLIAASYSRRSI